MSDWFDELHDADTDDKTIKAMEQLIGNKINDIKNEINQTIDGAERIDEADFNKENAFRDIVHEEIVNQFNKVQISKNKDLLDKLFLKIKKAEDYLVTNPNVNLQCVCTLFKIELAQRIASDARADFPTCLNKFNLLTRSNKFKVFNHTPSSINYSQEAISCDEKRKKI